MKAPSASCAVSFVLVLSACGAGDSVQSNNLAITGGAPEAGYPAVFSLAYSGVGGCTGTCISPHFGVTAAHCVFGESPETLSALFGDDELAPEVIVKVREAAMEPNGGDIAMLAFREACPAVIPANRIALEEHVTEPVVMVGFGVTAEEAEDYGVKRSGTATLFSVDPAEVNGLYAGELATSNDPGGTCYGDSGGPTFMTFDGVEAVVGITSRGSLDDQGLDEPCGEGLSIAARVDSYAAFIDQFIADNGGEVDPGDGGGAPDDEGGLPDDGGAHPGDGAAQPDPPDPTGDLDAPAADEPDEVPGGRVRGFAAGCATAPGSPGAGPAVLIVLAALAFVQRRRA